jgi:antitoxin (DNA-binding transcriptional repressor) of toxin-antitoxin stability system
MTMMTIQEAQKTLTDLIHRLAPGDEVLIIENDQAVAKLTVPQPEPSKRPRKLGTQHGSVLYMAPDFDAQLEDFKEHWN